MKTPEWMLKDDDDMEIFSLLTLEDFCADQKIIANFSQIKLLEYLKRFAISSGRSISYNKLEMMIKQIEENNG